MKMTPQQALEIQERLFAKALEILKKKRIDYSGECDAFANFRKSELFGVPPWKGAGIRLTDKLSRFIILAENGGKGAVEESIDDCIVDGLNYCVIMYELWLEEQDNRAP